MATLFVYHVERQDAYGMDQYSDFVVCAESEEAARKTHPDGISFLSKKGDRWLVQGHDGSFCELQYCNWVKH